MIAAIVAIAVIAVVAITTPASISRWITIALLVLVVGNVVLSSVQTAKLAPVVLETLRAKGPMTVSQVTRAIDRPRLRVIAALARLRANGAVTRAPLEGEQPGADPKDTHLYTAA